jgi:hypothetical protein
MTNMTAEFEENKTREFANKVSHRDSRKSLASIGSNQSLHLARKSRAARLADRKSIIEIANKELVDFSMDERVLKELKHLRKQSRAANTQHIKMNPDIRRKSVSTTQVNDITGGFNVEKGSQFNRDRRPTLVLPGELGGDDTLYNEGSLYNLHVHTIFSSYLVLNV